VSARRAVAPRALMLSLHVIYDHPTDYPDYFVVRRQDVVGGAVIPARDCLLFPSLEGARNWCRHLGLVSMGRMPEDDPKIAEVWT
jgi:hypothetical protein